MLYLAMRKFAGDLGTRDMAGLLAKLLVSGAAMAAVCIAADILFFKDPGKLPLWLRAGGLTATVAMAAAVYFAAARMLKVAEAQEAMAMVLRRFRR